MFEFDVALDGFPVFLLRVKGVTVFCHHLRRIDDGGRKLQQIRKAADVHLGLDQQRQHLHQPAHRFHQILRVAHEERERAHLVGGQDAALPQDEGQGTGRRQIGDHGERAVGPGGLQHFMLHAGGLRHEVAVDLLLDRKRLDGLRSGNPLVKVSGDLRIDLPDLMVQVEQPALEHREKHCDDGHHQEHIARQFRIDAEHHDRRTQDVQQEVDAVEQLPGKQLADAAGVADDPRMDVAHAVLVIVVEGELLQMRKSLVAHIPVQAQLRGEADAHAHVGDGRRRHDEKRIQQCIGPNALQRAGLYEVVQREFLQHGARRIRQTAQDLDEHDERETLFIGLGKGQQLGNAEERQPHFFLLFIHAQPPFRFRRDGLRRPPAGSRRSSGRCRRRTSARRAYPFP